MQRAADSDRFVFFCCDFGEGLHERWVAWVRELEPLAVLVDRGGRELPIAAAVSAARITLPKEHTLSLTKDDAGRFSFDIEEGT